MGVLKTRRLLKHKAGGLSIAFNGKTVDGITALCDLSYQNKSAAGTVGYSVDFDNYEFLGYFYSDLHSLLIRRGNNISIPIELKAITAPHFNPGLEIPCTTRQNKSQVNIYFFFGKDLSEENIQIILQDVITVLEDRWYVEAAGTFGRTIAFEESYWNGQAWQSKEGL